METNTLIAIVGLALSGSGATIGVYVSMSIRQALLKQALSHHNEKIKMLEQKVQNIEKDMMSEIKSIHTILNEIKISIIKTHDHVKTQN